MGYLGCVHAYRSGQTIEMCCVTFAFSGLIAGANTRTQKLSVHNEVETQSFNSSKALY